MQGQQHLTFVEDGLSLPITPGRPDLHAILGDLREATMADKGPASAFGKVQMYVGGHDALVNDVHFVVRQLNKFAAGPGFEVHREAWTL